jgi:hypothetical protein
VPELRKIVFNPADRTQGYKLWSHGFIEPIGSAPVPVQDPPFPDHWAVTNPVVDIDVINWSTPSGYTMTSDGEIRGFGGVVDPGIHGHLPTYGFDIWRWFRMNPNGDGSGYMVSFVGFYYRWGPTAPALSIATPDFQQDYARDFQLDWTTKKWVMLGKTGLLFSNFTISTTDVPPNPLNYDAYRSIIVRDWSTTPKILVSHMSAWLYGANGWGSYSGQPIEWQGRDVLADMALVHDGSGGQPMEIAISSKSGGVYRWFVSDPPVASWIAPVNGSTVTTTTRPSLLVSWMDPDGDTITGVDVRLFGPGLASITNPEAPGTPAPREQWLSDRRQTGYVPSTDLENGTWQAFVRVRDAANDLSAWAKTAWTQTVTRPPTPTLVALVIGYSVRLTVAGTTNASRFIFIEYSDDEGSTWNAVRGANPGPSILTGGVHLFDYEAPFQEDRIYRARVASVSPDLSSLWSTTATVNVSGWTWDLMKVSDHTSLRLRVDPDLSKSDPTGTRKFQPMAGSENVVLSTGWSEGDIPLTARVLSKSDRLALVEFLRSQETLLLRNPFGEAWYVQPTEDVTWKQLRSVALTEESTPIRDAREYSINFTVVRRPTA